MIGDFIGTPIGAGSVNEAVTEARWHQPWVEPRQTINRAKIVGAIIAVMAAGPFTPPLGFDLPTIDKYQLNLSEPVRLDLRSGIAPQYQQFLAFQLDEAQQPEEVTESRWHQPWSEPKRFKAGLLTGDQPFSGFLNPQPVVFETIPWFATLSEPVRFKVGLGSYLQRAFTEDTADTLQPRSVPSWYAPLSEPKRFPKGLEAYLQDYGPVKETVQPEPNRLIQWFTWLSDPVREPIGLKSWLQQTLAYPPRLLPTPDITGTMAATEVNSDVALIGINVYGSGGSGATIASAKVSITEGPDALAATSLRES